MPLPLDIIGVIGTTTAKSVVARVYFPPGLETLGLVITPADDTGNPITVADEATHFDLLLIEGPDAIYGRSASLSTLPDTTDRPYTLEVRETAATLDIGDPSEWAAAFDAATEILAPLQTIDRGFVSNDTWSIDGAASGGGGGGDTIDIDLEDVIIQ